MINLTPPLNSVEAYELLETRHDRYIIQCYGLSFGEKIDRQDMGVREIQLVDGQSAHETIRAYLADVDARPLPPLPTPDQLRATLRARASERRWKVETGGVTLPNGLSIDTDDRTKVLINGVVTMAQLDQTFTTRWKASDGTWHLLDAPTIIALAKAISTHVDACFAREGELHDQIAAAPDRAALEALRPAIEAFWP